MHARSRGHDYVRYSYCLKAIIMTQRTLIKLLLIHPKNMRQQLFTIVLGSALITVSCFNIYYYQRVCCRTSVQSR